MSGGGGASLRGMLMAVGGGGGRSSKVVVSSGDFSNSARGAVSSGSGDTELGRESMVTNARDNTQHSQETIRKHRGLTRVQEQEH